MQDICHLNLAKNFRGGERQTELLIRELAWRGYSQRLVIRRGNSLKERCADIVGLNIREVASNPLAAGLAARGSRVAHAHDARTVYSGLMASLFFGVPYVITRRVVAPQSNKFIRRWAYRRAARLVAISEAVVRSIKTRLAEVEATVIPDARSGFESDAETVEAIRARYPGKILIGNIGALDHSHKGQSTIIDAARRVADSQPDWQFVICGEGKDEARYRSEIGDLTNIELIGWVDNVGDYLASFDVFLFPSLHEALGSTLLDALQFGVPIVATDVDGIPSIIENGINGLLVQPEQPEQIVEAIEGILREPDRAQAMCERNMAKAGDYDVERMVNAYLLVYESV